MHDSPDLDAAFYESLEDANRPIIVDINTARQLNEAAKQQNENKRKEG